MSVDWTLCMGSRASPLAEAEKAKAEAAIVRPPFPPASLNLEPAFPAELGHELGGELLVLWAAIHSFSSMLGLW